MIIKKFFINLKNKSFNIVIKFVNLINTSAFNYY
jgi:hypothetical protein